MAREAPPRNTIYTWMLAVSLGAILVGCLTLAVELNGDYDWTMEAKGGPPITLPTAGPAPGTTGAIPAPKERETTAKAPVKPTPTPAPATIPPPTVALTNPILAPAPAILPPVIPSAKPTEPALTNQPKPTGIIPSPLKIPGGR